MIETQLISYAQASLVPLLPVNPLDWLSTLSLRCHQNLKVSFLNTTARIKVRPKEREEKREMAKKNLLPSLLQPTTSRPRTLNLALMPS